MGTARAVARERRIAYEPLPSQRKFHSLENRVIGFSGPVGSGKTAAFVQHALLLAHLNPGLPGVIGAPTYRLLSDVTRSAFLEALAVNGIPHRFGKSDNEVFLHEPRSTVRFRSLDKPQGLVGANVAWVGVDELTFCREESFDKLLARLRHKRARRLQAFAVWTPRGHEWVYRRFVGPKSLASYGVVLARPHENKHLADGFYELLKESYDERLYEQEVLGRYVARFAGQVYYNFERAANVRALEYDRHLPLCWALDFNIDPMCSVIVQLRDETTRAEQLAGRKSYVAHVLDEIVLPDARTEDAAREFVKRIDPWLDSITELQIFGDASGGGRQRQTLKSDWAVIKEYLRSALPGHVRVVWRVPPANPEVRERVTRVTSAILTASGKRRLLVDPRCEELLSDFDQLSWKRDAAGRVLDDIDDNKDRRRGHLSDALGYLVHRGMREDPPGPR